MKYNYPVKYAIMPIYEQVGWMSGLHELERSYEVVGNIVSKCYVVSKKISYLEDGSEEKEFEVVFPYRKTDYRRTYDWERVYPEFSFGRNCINSNIVRELYDNFEKDRDGTQVFFDLGFEVVEETKWKKFNKDVDGIIVRKIL